MKKLFILALLTAFAAQGQINDEGTGVQVIAYFNKGEKYTYDLTLDEANIKGTDTIYTLRLSYKVDVTVVDSTATGYEIEWKYRNYKAEEADEFTKKIIPVSEGLLIRFSTDELGIFQELLNLEDIQDYNRKAFKAAFKGHDLKVTVEQMLEKLSTREAIETFMMRDILLFHTFHGTPINSGEIIQEEIEEESALSKKPIKSSILLELDEIDLENRDFVVRFYQSFNAESVDDLVGFALQDFMETQYDGNIETSSLEDYIGAQIHETGWPINLYYERVVDINKQQGLEIRTITLE